MYKIPKDLNLDHLIGLDVTSVQLDKYNVLINLYSKQNDHINIGDGTPWELLGKDGKTIDQQMDFDSRESFKIHKLIGDKIAAYKVESPNCLTFKFDSGFVLKVHDDSDQYESFSITPNIFI